VQVLSYDFGKGRCEVKGDTMQNAMLIKPENLRLVDRTDSTTCISRDLVGSVVFIKNLKSRPEWNGRRAVVQSHSSDSERYTVLIDGVDSPKMLHRLVLCKNSRADAASNHGSQVASSLAVFEGCLKNLFIGTPSATSSKTKASAALAGEINKGKTSSEPVPGADGYSKNSSTSPEIGSKLQASASLPEEIDRVETASELVPGVDAFSILHPLRLDLTMPVFSTHGCPECFAAYMYIYAGSIDLVELYYEREVLKSLCAFQKHNIEKRVKKGHQPVSAAWRRGGDCVASPAECLFREWVSASMLEGPKTKSPNFEALKKVVYDSRSQSNVIIGIVLVAAGEYLSTAEDNYDHEFCLVFLNGRVYIIDRFLAHPSVRSDASGLDGIRRRKGLPNVRELDNVENFMTALQSFLNQPDDPAALAAIYGIDNYYGNPSQKVSALKLARVVREGKWTPTQTECFKMMFGVDFSNDFETREAEHAPLLLWKAAPIFEPLAQSRYEQLIRSGKLADELHKQHCGKAEARLKALSFDKKFSEYKKYTESVELSNYTLDFD
jgi:hypothetical protein